MHCRIPFLHICHPFRSLSPTHSPHIFLYMPVWHDHPTQSVIKFSDHPSGTRSHSPLPFLHPFAAAAYKNRKCSIPHTIRSLWSLHRWSWSHTAFCWLSDNMLQVSYSLSFLTSPFYFTPITLAFLHHYRFYSSSFRSSTISTGRSLSDT